MRLFNGCATTLFARITGYCSFSWPLIASPLAPRHSASTFCFCISTHSPHLTHTINTLFLRWHRKNRECTSADILAAVAASAPTDLCNMRQVGNGTAAGAAASASASLAVIAEFSSKIQLRNKNNKGRQQLHAHAHAHDHGTTPAVHAFVFDL